jgi:uncharacterized protein (DUF305 family)
MNSLKMAFLAAALVAVLPAQAFSQSSEMPISTPLPEQCPAPADHSGMPAMDMSGMDAAHQEFMAAMQRMEPSMMGGMLAEDPDVAFACGMIAHHQGAIDMAKVELAHGDNEEAKKMAQKIIDAQMKEIDEFKAWLAANAKQ